MSGTLEGVGNNGGGHSVVVSDSVPTSNRKLWGTGALLSAVATGVTVASIEELVGKLIKLECKPPIAGTLHQAACLYLDLSFAAKVTIAIGSMGLTLYCAKRAWSPSESKVITASDKKDEEKETPETHKEPSKVTADTQAKLTRRRSRKEAQPDEPN